MIYNVLNMPQVLDIGLTGSNRQFDFFFDVKPWLAEYPDAVFAVCVQRPGDDETGVYFGDTRTEDGILVWTVHAADIGIPGNGKIELWALSTDDTENDAPLFKAGPVITRCRQSVAGNAGADPPEAVQNWFESMLAAAGSVTQAKNSAESAKQDAETARDNAVSAAVSAEEARDTAIAARNLAGNAVEEAEAAADRAEAAVGSSGYFEIGINEEGHLIYNRTENIETLDFSLENGHLIMEVT